MAQETDALPKTRLSVRVTDEDHAELKRVLSRLPGLKEAPLTQMLLHYAIQHAGEAIASLLKE